MVFSWKLLLRFLVFFSVAWKLYSTYVHSDPMRARYEQWVGHYGRDYGDKQEKEHRFGIFRNNIELIESHNSLNLGYVLSENKFADMTNEEFRAKITCLGHIQKPIHHVSEEPAYAPAPMCETPIPSCQDWRDKGAVTQVKDQGQCELGAPGHHRYSSKREEAA